MMVISTKHKVHYTTQLRNRLEREGFLTYPVPDRDVEATWCNAVTLMKVSKDLVNRGKLGFLVIDAVPPSLARTQIRRPKPRSKTF